MAIVVYKCDTCKRELEIARREDGLDIIQNCIITHGCRGNLYQLTVLPDFVRGSIPDDVPGLDNWLPRKVLHNHVQGIERIEWLIQHDMGTFPAIQVLVDRPIEGNENNTEEIQPLDIVIIDKNNIKLVFDRPWSGISQLVARQSDPDLLDPTVNELDTSVTSQQISNAGEITIATRVSTIGSSPVANIRLLFRTTQGSTPIISYSIDDQPSLLSAWSDFDTVVIKGSIYTVRSFNALTPEMTSGIIGNGSTFVFQAIDPEGDNIFRDIEKSEVILLTATAPYSTVDKTVDEHVDVTMSTVDDVLYDFFYDTGEFFVQTSIIQPIYPHIRST